MRWPSILLSINNHTILLPSSIWWGVDFYRWYLRRTWKITVTLLLFSTFDLPVYSVCCLPPSATSVSCACIVPATCQNNFTVFDPITGINWNLGTTEILNMSLSYIFCGGTKYSTLNLSPHTDIHITRRKRQSDIIHLITKLNLWFLEAFAKLQTANFIFVMSVRLSVCLHGTSQLPLDEYSWNLIFEDLSKIRRGNSSFIKI
jgi:hypothetical protein